MRINRYIAQATGLSRRAADAALAEGRVHLNGRPAGTGTVVTDNDDVTLDGRAIRPPVNSITIMLNKPVGYVSSRQGQGSKTIYDLLPPELHHLKPVGRLDKDSSGLLLLTNDGELANKLTHPRYQKQKVYEVILDKPLTAGDKAKLEQGIMLADGPSRLEIKSYGLRQKPTTTHNLQPITYEVTMSEGRNRQIRRTFAALGYVVNRLHRTSFGPYELKNLQSGNWQVTVNML